MYCTGDICKWHKIVAGDDCAISHCLKAKYFVNTQNYWLNGVIVHTIAVHSYPYKQWMLGLEKRKSNFWHVLDVIYISSPKFSTVRWDLRSEAHFVLFTLVYLRTLKFLGSHHIPVAPGSHASRPVRLRWASGAICLHSVYWHYVHA